MPTRIQGLAEQCRQVSTSRLLGDWEEWRKHFGQAVNILARTGANDDAWRAADVVALRLYQAATASNSISVRIFSIRALSRLGSFGVGLAVDLCASGAIGESHLVALNSKMEPRERLLLCNEALSNSTFPSFLNPLLEQALEDARQLEPAQAAGFVDEAASGPGGIDHMVARALRQGIFGRWLSDGGAGELSRDSAHRVCRAVSALRERELVPTVVASLADEAKRLPPAALRLAAECAPRGVHAEETARLVSAAFAKGDVSSRKATVLALICMRWPRTPRVLAAIHSRMPGYRRHLLPALLLLGEEGFAQFLNLVSEGERREISHRLFELIAELQPEFCLAVLRRRELLGAREVREDVAQGLREVFGKLERAAGEGCRVSVPTRPRTLQGPTLRSGFFAKLLGRDKAGLQEEAKRSMDISDLDLEGTGLEGAALKDRAIRRLKLRGVFVQSSLFENCAFVDSDLSSATLRSAEFVNCTFTECSFIESVFLECRFTACTFLRCDFAGAWLENSAFGSCVLRESHGAGASLLNVRASEFEAVCCLLHGLQAVRCRFESGRFARCRFNGSGWLELTTRGVAFERCGLSGMTLADCRFYSSPAVNCDFTGTLERGTQADEPGWLAFLQELLAERVLEMTGDSAEWSGDILDSEDGEWFAERCLRVWQRHRAMAVDEEAMQSENHRRLDLMRRRMSPDQAEFATMLPLLLGGEGLDTAYASAAGPPCEIHGYHPSLEAVRLVKKYFPEAGFRARGGVGIAGLYAMGSMGTLAQTRESDLDCWVCLEEGTDEEKVERLRGKLAGLEKWAWERFGLETHFFLMRLEDVRANRFGISDQDSSGTAQALLLKDEFYRTALKLAGDMPAWWLLPPGLGREEYRERCRDALLYPLLEPPRVCDLGALEPIPPQEFFGACMWQIVKAIKSPFKSVMKFGLLERYAEEAGKGRLLLCDRIKGRIQLGTAPVFSLDPYAALFQEVRELYLRREDEEALRLMREAYLLKAGLDQVRMELGQPRHADEDVLVGWLTDEKGMGGFSSLRRDTATWGFTKTVEMGRLVNTYVLATYNRIRERLGEGEALLAAKISPEDLTKLGRRITALYSRKKGKIERLPFAALSGREFSELVLAADKAPGKRTVWHLSGKRGGASKLLRKEADPARLLLWAVANGVYAAGQMVRGDRTAAPSPRRTPANWWTCSRTFSPPKRYSRWISPPAWRRRRWSALYCFSI
ncbi:class I adenylate cyclase [Desulfohalovibrio reitneri]|uniref:class I adenylate cyclase n=1 Tax=Desulfohalovibrio reitneri TaxID=1307759 RepID=UPI000689C19B|nr:class I adenylate cyclase [Desulfohalovibrio reitneri]